jgi:HAD superfamily hydrolase (TIGR01509 family)
VVKAVIFDLDGTLVDAFGGIHESLMHTMRVFGFVPHPFEATKRMVGHGLQELLARAMNPQIAAEALTVYRAHYKDIAVSSALPLPGADALLKDLHAQGNLLALASNKLSTFCRQIVDGKGWGSYFDVVLGPDTAGAAKPHPVMLQRALEALRVSADEALYVGDMTIDLETARAAKVKVALVATGSLSKDELIAAGAEIVLDSLEQVRPLVFASRTGDNLDH